MIAEELKKIIMNIPDDSDAIFEIRDSLGNKHQLEIESANAKKQVSIKDAVFAIKMYCASRSGLMYSCRNCPFNKNGICVVSDLNHMDVEDLPNDRMSIRREE